MILFEWIGEMDIRAKAKIIMSIVTCVMIFFSIWMVGTYPAFSAAFFILLFLVTYWSDKKDTEGELAGKKAECYLQLGKVSLDLKHANEKNEYLLERVCNLRDALEEIRIDERAEQFQMRRASEAIIEDDHAKNTWNAYENR